MANSFISFTNEEYYLAIKSSWVFKGANSITHFVLFKSMVSFSHS